jgi:hypothetical protein
MPGASVVQQEGKAIQQLMKKKGMTLADLLQGLEGERAAYIKEKYGIEV